MRRWVIRAAIVLAVVLAGMALRATVFRPDAVPVTLFRAARGTVEETVTNSKAGTVKARRRSRISTEVGGRVDFIGARAGDRVRKGDVLLRIYDRDLRASLNLAEQDLATARAAAQEACFAAGQAERDLKRNLDLKVDRIVSEEMLERLRATRDGESARCEAVQAGAGRAAAAVDLARANLGKTVLIAPFDGVVAELKAEVGEWVSPSPPALPIPPVFDLIDPGSIYVSAPMDEVDAGRVATGQAARITLDPFPGRSFTGKVTRVAPYVQDVEQQNRTFEVEVDLDDAEFARRLLPGTSADVEVVLRRSEQVLRIPSYALLEGDRVLVYTEGRTLLGRRIRVLRSRSITAGLKNWEFAEVREGLQEGDPVVVSLDRSEIKDGAYAIERASGTAGGGPGP
jgi:HlyD family secretion protein